MTNEPPDGLHSRKEWNASVYHQVSDPHVDWGEKVIADLVLPDNPLIVDVGCGTGRVTAMLLNAFPDSRAIAVDQSRNMLDQAESSLTPVFPDRLRFLQSDLLELTPEQIGEPADLVFSTATFHWIHDHDLLFQRLFALLRPGGQLVAQCGGGPNIEAILNRAGQLMAQTPYVTHFANFDFPWFFADAASTASRLERAGFAQVTTEVIRAPALLADEETFRQFVANVIFREHLSALPNQELRDAFVNSLTKTASQDDPPFELDYWRLNLRGYRPT